ncbi:uncharacterized protein AMSG_07935 [Thecamonas trahens ATCC 50062]|uniref:Uncharacterized protein n=1 Tax=Thecamonas trahens ATCC 50062 TaxID=461836 RepID=A0A0L0DIB6_THETB|nr:hypothetical protein AMSG_07935 [Thecamonas trahens ATCC 50062]KNC51846.1 hypothetical protein AMSG_07935 [Thecamonas trahens ATCC 50062]|eukprot:XP_013755710.1 hypothetical protein AMSG_07935 [Thecamonas trahens ATCC 50062]
MLVTTTVVSASLKGLAVSTGLAVFRRLSGFRLRTAAIGHRRIRAAAEGYLQAGEWTATAIAAQRRKAAELANRRSKAA